ncbi:MAG TPA: strawberry notch C-terminal domain-containing protein [Williamwhitmania sp.]|nr:strawberry notch C-terminal domain-containing protein [Williamwhitmania sp.]
MKQHEILYKFFKTAKDDTIKFCLDIQSDYKLNVLGIYYITLPKVGKLPKNYLQKTRYYLGGADLKRIVLLQGVSGPYHPGAEFPVRSLETIVPDSMDYEIHVAVSNVKEEVGSINAYVRSKLGYKSDQELADALSAEQVDAVAMAIYNIEEKEQAIIIGDQTGIGKGRIAAAMIRYARKNGHKPVFVTEKPNLFSDIFRDLSAIGSAELIPFIVNSNESKTKVKDENGNVVYEAPAKNIQDKIFSSGKLPSEFDYVMLTYSQVASEKPTAKQIFVSQVSKGNVLILDESHNAGGNLETSFTAKYFFEMVKESKGVVFLSATFAKRPDNMPLYAVKTAMSEASMSHESLVDAITKGGVALQEVVSSSLVSEGQMIRRERSFDGVEVNYITLDANGARDFGIEDKEQEHRAVSDRITDVLRKIIEFQKEFISPVVEEMDDASKGSMEEVTERQGTKDLGVDSPPFFSKLFNVVNQMLFSIKADAVADRAIQRLKEGKKPVIAFSNTMASFLESMENERGNAVTQGDMVNTDFTEVLKRGLDGVRRITRKVGNGKTVSEEISLESLSPEARAFYNSILNQIRNISTGISISPIDVIKGKIEAAGYSVAEVTGRTLEVQLTPGKVVGLVQNRKRENVNDAFRRFNDNEVDVLMINQAGSTGASAHAIVTKKVSLEKVKQRVMIMLQAELDINREVQKRGRINRTGQVYKPIYDYIYSSIPAEKRLAMMLQKKLKSLDANTTSNQKNSETIMKSDDFLNKYGDEIVVTYLSENPELNEVIGDPLKLNGTKAENTEDAAHRVSGRIAVLATKEQQRFYEDILDRYRQSIEYLVQTGDYDLEVESMNLDAVTVDSKIAVAGIKGGKSAFAGSTFLEECMVNNLRKPFSKVDLDNNIASSLAGRAASEIQQELKDKFKEYVQTKAKEDEEEISRRHNFFKENITKDKKYLKLDSEADKKGFIAARLKEIEEGEVAAINLLRGKIQNSYDYIVKFFDFFTIGRSVKYPFGDGEVAAVFLGFKIDSRRPNPYAPSAIVARFAVANSLKYVELVLSGEQGNKLTAIIGLTYRISHSQARSIVDDWDSICKESSASRKKVFIYTGNILQAYSVANGGKLISYTMQSGEVKKGILMPDGWKQKAKGGSTRTIVPLISAKRVVKGLTEGAMLETDNGVSIMRVRNGFRLITNGLSIQKYGWLVKSEQVIKYITNNGGFQRQSSSWIGDLDVNNIEHVLTVIYDLTKTTVGLSESQMQLVADEIDTARERPRNVVFPKLIEMEVRLFKMLEADGNMFNGLGLPSSAMSAFETLKKYYPLKAASPQEKIVAEMVEEVALHTGNFKNPSAIGIEKYEVKNLLESERISPAEWLERNKTLRRSEADVVEWLAQKVLNLYETPNQDKNKKIRIAKARAKALLLLQLQN